MKAVPANPEQLVLLCQYMRDKTDAVISPDMAQGFAVVNGAGEFTAGVVISNVRYSNGKAIDCEISCATETSIAWRPEVCRAIFGYVFNQLGCVRCTSIVKKNNKRCRQFLTALKFELEGTVRRGYDGEKDALIYGLLAGDCEFLGGLNG